MRFKFPSKFDIIGDPGIASRKSHELYDLKFSLEHMCSRGMWICNYRNCVFPFGTIN
jgi:hypothetical protein